jgi:hypothetical protein
MITLLTYSQLPPNSSLKKKSDSIWIAIWVDCIIILVVAFQ